jgi:hypothetical protein
MARLCACPSSSESSLYASECVQPGRALFPQSGTDPGGDARPTPKAELGGAFPGRNGGSRCSGRLEPPTVSSDTTEATGNRHASALCGDSVSVFAPRSRCEMAATD